jgi:hypothetical protein
MMDNRYYLPQHIKFQSRAMVFVDGENLAIRYKELLAQREPQPHVTCIPDIFVWTYFANVPHHLHCEFVRRYYYTSVTGDDHRVREVERQIKDAGIEAPRVFKKPKCSGTEVQSRIRQAAR